MTVSLHHPEYDLNYDIWKTTRDSCIGNPEIKKRSKDGVVGAYYLPMFVPKDEERFKQYLMRAYYMNVTGRTKESLVGMIFRKPARFDMPQKLLDILEDIDGAGQSLDQIAKAAAGDILETGRYIFLTDYPAVEDGLSAEQEASLGLHPTIAAYPAESLINWRFDGVNGKQMLTLAVLQEQVEDQENDEFSHDTDTIYRVLRLRDGIYTQQLYDENGIPQEEYIPRMAGGQPFGHIPLHIAGASNNKPDVDMPPLYDLAIVNIAHYQTTADHRENLYVHGQLTLGISSKISWQEFKEANPDGVKVGARTGHYLGEGGSFSTATAPESSSLRVGLQDLENQMIMIGARLIQRGGQAETAEAARINASAEASTLDTVVSNLSEAIEGALEDCARFMGLPVEGIEYKLNTQFWEAAIDPQAVMAIIQLGEQKVIAQSDQRHMIRNGKIEFPEGRTDEQIDLEIANRLLDEPAG